MGFSYDQLTHTKGLYAERDNTLTASEIYLE